VLDLVDHLLTKGVMLDGEVVLGLAGIDLVYLRLSALLCAADRVRDGAVRRARTGPPVAARPRPRALFPPVGTTPASQRRARA
jgi:hypothetical protein